MRAVFLFLTLAQISDSEVYFGRQTCPNNLIKEIKILWTAYTPFYIHKEHNDTLNGIFPRIWKNSMAKCCSRLNYTFEEVEYEANKSHKMRIIDEMQEQNDSIFVIFPSLSSWNDGKDDLSFFKFIPIKVSPGPMVLATRKAMEINIGFNFFYVIWINPVFLFTIAMIALSVAIFWIMVCIFVYTFHENSHF